MKYHHMFMSTGKIVKKKKSKIPNVEEDVENWISQKK